MKNKSLRQIQIRGRSQDKRLEIDLALWGFILGAIGTAGAVLSVFLTILEIRDRLGAKSGERENEAKGIFQGVFGAIKEMDDSSETDQPFAPLDRFLETIRAYKDEIFAVKSVLEKVSPKISANLVQLVEFVGKKTYERFEIVTMGHAGDMLSDPKFKLLISTLRKDIEKWLSDHA